MSTAKQNLGARGLTGARPHRRRWVPWLALLVVALIVAAIVLFVVVDDDDDDDEGSTEGSAPALVVLSA